MMKRERQYHKRKLATKYLSREGGSRKGEYDAMSDNYLYSSNILLVYMPVCFINLSENTYSPMGTSCEECIDYPNHPPVLMLINLPHLKQLIYLRVNLYARLYQTLDRFRK
jgi:hypothetical protein